MATYIEREQIVHLVHWSKRFRGGRGGVPTRMGGGPTRREGGPHVPKLDSRIARRQKGGTLPPAEAQIGSKMGVPKRGSPKGVPKRVSPKGAPTIFFALKCRFLASFCHFCLENADYWPFFTIFWECRFY